MLGIFGSLYAAVAVLGIAAGVLSVGPLQFAEVNVLYVPGVSSEQGFTPPDPCVVDVAIFDGQGNQAKFQEFSLMPGQSGHLSAVYGDLKGGAQAGSGVQGVFTVRSSVQDTCGNDQTCDASLCSISQAVEVVDSKTGVTRVLVDGPVQLIQRPAQAQAN
jgi:hypothetical protein